MTHPMGDHLPMLVVDPMMGWVMALAFSIFFATAARHKWRDPARLAAIVARYRLLPSWASKPVGLIVTVLETVVSLGLLYVPTRAMAGFAGALLLMMYAVAMSINLRRGRTDLDCGCTGPRERRPIARWMVVRNLLLAPSLGLLCLPLGPRAFETVDALSVVGGVGVLLMLYAATDRLYSRILPALRLLEAS